MGARTRDLFVRMAVLLAGAAALPVWACSSFSGGDDGAADGGAEAEATVPDGASTDVTNIPDTATDASADGADAAKSLLLNAGFEESPALTCAPGWQTLAGSSQNVTIKHSGTYGCLVCGNSSSYGRMFRAPNIANPAPGTYLLTAYVREGPDGGASVNYLVLTARFPDAGPAMLVKTAAPGPTFVPQSALLDVAAGATVLEVSLEVLAGANGGCVVYDDVTLTFTPP